MYGRNNLNWKLPFTDGIVSLLIFFERKKSRYIVLGILKNVNGNVKGKLAKFTNIKLISKGAIHLTQF